MIYIFIEKIISPIYFHRKINSPKLRTRETKLFGFQLYNRKCITFDSRFIAIWVFPNTLTISVYPVEKNYQDEIKTLAISIFGRILVMRVSIQSNPFA